VAHHQAVVEPKRRAADRREHLEQPRAGLDLLVVDEAAAGTERLDGPAGGADESPDSRALSTRGSSLPAPGSLTVRSS